jgi:LmbE family N-acetylglucosaminyl deacetylase
MGEGDMGTSFASRIRIGGSLAVILAAVALLGVLASRPARGQSPALAAQRAATPNAMPLAIDSGAVGLWQTLLELHTRASLLMVEAHPDDEDGGMLAYETRGHGVRGDMLTLNRGEGGQNVMSDDFYDALGLVRTEELLAADRYYGVRQFFSSVVDFGFSKTREESLAQWGHQRVLADVVRVVRMTRPLVIVSTFVGGPSDGHGHHAVAGETAQEAFLAAGDPRQFPDQIRAGLRPWSPVKVYARVPRFTISKKGMFDYATGKYHPVRFYNYITKKWSDHVPSVTVRIPDGAYDPVLGATFLQIAREGWSHQKSQNGGGRIPFAGPADSPYHRYASLLPGAATEHTLFDGVDVSLAGIADLAKGQDNSFLKAGLGRINTQVEQAMREFSIEQPGKIAPQLAEGLKETNALAAQVSSSHLSGSAKYDVEHELALKQWQFQHAIVLALGLSLNATVAARQQPRLPRFFGSGPEETFAYAIPGQKFSVDIHLNNPNPSPLSLDRIWLDSPAGKSWRIAPEKPVPTTASAAKALDQRFAVQVPENAAPTRPYFTRPNDEQPYYQIIDERDRNLPLAPYPLSAWVEFTYDGVKVRDGQVVQTARQETGPGVVLNPLMVAPAVSVRIAPQAGITPLGSKSFQISALLHTEAERGAKGVVRLELPPGWHAKPAVASFALQRAGQDEDVDFQVFPNQLEEKPYTVTAVAESGGREYRDGFVTTGYAGLRPYNLYMPATYRTSGVPVQVSKDLRIGYVMGTGDSVPQSLENLGVKVTFLGPQDLAQGNLQQFGVIVLGVRAYSARPDLAANNERLLDYVKQGGVVVVQYNSVEYNHDYGPYPYNLPGDAEKVVDETSRVGFADPHDPLLDWPNRITEKDFTGWVEERGHDFLKSWDSHYHAPLDMHDAGQDPQRGGLVYARYGRGVYVYVALALYRQLPDGVPGAYRLFANLLSLPRNPAFQAAGASGDTARKR